MKKPILLIMAAGLGSRYGGLKQIDPIDEFGHIILDYSIYDAMQAGIEEVVCIIKKENLNIFEEMIGSKLKGRIKLHYAFQELSNIPEGFEVPKDRVKPWGTAHAVLSAKEYINAPFIVINADDFYGRTAFEIMYNYLTTHDKKSEHAMVGYKLSNTLTENGHVARGVCTVDADSNLIHIIERTHIEIRNGGGAFTEDGKEYHFIDGNTPVSMNFWGFQKSMIQAIEDNFPIFLKDNLDKNPLKCEYFLPFVPDLLLKSGKASVKALNTSQKWYGVTYQEDKPNVQNAIKEMIESGLYPKNFWS